MTCMCEGAGNRRQELCSLLGRQPPANGWASSGRENKTWSTPTTHGWAQGHPSMCTCHVLLQPRGNNDVSIRLQGMVPGKEALPYMHFVVFHYYYLAVTTNELLVSSSLFQSVPATMSLPTTTAQVRPGTNVTSCTTLPVSRSWGS